MKTHRWSMSWTNRNLESPLKPQCRCRVFQACLIRARMVNYRLTSGTPQLMRCNLVDNRSLWTTISTLAQELSNSVYQTSMKTPCPQETSQQIAVNSTTSLPQICLFRYLQQNNIIWNPWPRPKGTPTHPLSSVKLNASNGREVTLIDLSKARSRSTNHSRFHKQQLDCLPCLQLTKDSDLALKSIEMIEGSEKALLSCLWPRSVRATACLMRRRKLILSAASYKRIDWNGRTAGLVDKSSSSCAKIIRNWNNDVSNMNKSLRLLVTPRSSVSSLRLSIGKKMLKKPIKKLRLNLKSSKLWENSTVRWRKVSWL